MSKPKKVILADGTPVWEIRVREGGRNSSERRRRFASLKEANDFLMEMTEQRKRLNQGYVEVGSFHSTTFKKEAENWITHIRLRCSPGHLRRVKDILEDFNQNFGGLEPNKITLNFMTELQGRLKGREGRKGPLWTNASVNRYTEVICAVLNFAAEQRRIPLSPVTGFKKLPRNSPEMLFWDEDEASFFLAKASEKYLTWTNKSRSQARKNYIVYLLALNTGMRAGEIWGLKPADLSFSDEDGSGTIFVRRQLNGLTRQYGPLKGELMTDSDKSRHAPCPEGLRQELESLIKFNKTGRDEPLFQSVHGTPFNHDSFVDKFDRDVARWNLRPIRFHDLRHTAATLMLSKGIDVKTVSEILGHEDLQTTMRYVHLLGNKIKQVSASFAVKPDDKLERKKLQLVQGGRNA